MGRRIKEAREAAGLSREAVARAIVERERCDSTVESMIRTVYRYESQTPPPIARLLVLSDLFGRSMHWLATGREEAAA